MTGSGTAVDAARRTERTDRTDRTVRIVRAVLVVLGVLVLLFGAYTMVTTLKPHRIWGLVTWLVGAVILHDGILSPFVVLAGAGLRRTGRRLQVWALVVVQAAVVVGAVLTLVVLPEIGAKHHGAKNATVVPFDYTLRLVVTWVVLAAVTAIVLVVAARLRRRNRSNDARS